jgi:hypothetical protein
MDAESYAAAINRVTKASDHYAVLGVARGASAEAVKAAYRSLAVRVHPDRNDQPGAEEAFKKLVEAYVVLSDAKQRQIYDAMQMDGHAGGQPSGGNRKAQHNRPPTAEQVAAEAELDKMLQQEFERARHADWVQRARFEQASAVLLGLGVAGFCVLGLFLAVVHFAWPEPTSGPQALQPGWDLRSSITWLCSFAGRLVIMAVTTILLIVAMPYALRLFVFGVGKFCEWGFDLLALVGRVLYPHIEAYVNGMASRRGNEQRRGRRR